jgi:hypothetical protein
MKMAASGLKAEFRNHVWTYDFMFRPLNNGRKNQVLMLEDEVYGREGERSQSSPGSRGNLGRTGRRKVSIRTRGTSFFNIGSCF